MGRICEWGIYEGHDGMISLVILEKQTWKNWILCMYTTSHVVLFQLGVCTFSSLGPMLLTSGLWNGQSESNKLLCSILCWWIRPGRHIPHKGSAVVQNNYFPFLIAFLDIIKFKLCNFCLEFTDTSSWLHLSKVSQHVLLSPDHFSRVHVRGLGTRLQHTCQ